VIKTLKFLQKVLKLLLYKPNFLKKGYCVTAHYKSPKLAYIYFVVQSI